MATHNEHAFDDRINKFNIIMNLGHRLALEFEKEFGGILCREIAGCDFTSSEGVESYLRGSGPAKCERVAAWTAARVQGDPRRRGRRNRLRADLLRESL